MIRRPPRSTQSRSSAASDVYKRQVSDVGFLVALRCAFPELSVHASSVMATVSYTHLRAHETRHEFVCRLLLENKQGKMILNYWKRQRWGAILTATIILRQK